MNGGIVIKAIIMAGGKGTRLKPLTCCIPKPMVPILNKPTMEYTIELLKRHKISDIGVTIAHLPNKIIDYFGQGEKWGVNIKYFEEDIPLGTGGSVKNAEDFIEKTFIVLSGDAITDIDIDKAVDFHKRKGSKATLVLKNEAYPVEYGVVIVNNDGNIRRFLEKPSWGEVFSNTINTGIYVLEPEVLGYFKRGENFDFSKDLFPKLLADGVAMYGYITNDYWCDVGALDSYVQTHFDLLDRKVDFQLSGHEIEKGVWVGNGTQIDRNVSFQPPVYIGEDCIIRGGSKIEAYTVIGDGCSIGKGVSLKRSVFWNNVVVGQNADCRGGVICKNVKISRDVEIYENAVIGDDSRLDEGVIIKPNIKIWPEKWIEEKTIVNENLVWGTKACKNIFGFKGVSGEMNIDVSPEFASKLGAAFVSTLKGKPTIIVSSDASNASKIIKNALVVGMRSSGSGIIDIGKTVMPVNRFAIERFNGSGGIHIRMDKMDRNLVHIEFADEKGVNIQRSAEREIENLFNREEFKRCKAEDIQSSLNIENFQEFYINNGMDFLMDIPAIKRKSPLIIISSKSSLIQELGGQFLKRIGCNIEIIHDSFNEIPMKDYLEIMIQKTKERVADFGVIINENGEEMALITQNGDIIKDEKFDILAIMLLLKEGYKGKLVLAYNAPSGVEKIAQVYGVEIIRVKSSPASVMNGMTMVEQGKQKGLSQYIMTYHAIWGLGMIVDFLTRNTIKLEDLLKEIPKFYFIKDKISCEWQDKGRIIQQLAQEYLPTDIELFEGVKIKDKRGWTLILPDSAKPLFNIYTEGFSEEYAEELSVFYKEKIKNLLKSQK